MKLSTIIKEIVTISSSNYFLLKQKALPASLPFSSATLDTIQILEETIKSKGKAAGLAAPQIGINTEIIICSFTGDNQDLEVMVNPAYSPNGEILEEGWEGCFSVPLTFANVLRWENIFVSYYNKNACLINKLLSGFPARVYQHECDHLKGRLMIDKAVEIKTFENEAEFNHFLQKVRQQRTDDTALNDPSNALFKCRV